jgi:ADP-heptose:LPS heptosyltransferase
VGESAVVAPASVNGLLALIERAGLFVGNDSGPGHLAALSGLPTFSVFGPQLPEWFAPLHPQGECVDGKPCPYKPCSDYCRFAEPICMTRLSEDEVWARLKKFLARHEPAEDTAAR